MAEERVGGAKSKGKAEGVKADKATKTAAPKAAAGARKATGTKTAKDADGGPVRGGLAQTVTPDAALAKVIGGDPATRAEITKRIWEYVRKNALQDKKDGRVIHADEQLKPVFGGKEQVTMFEMTKLVNQHVA
ncbi:MAG: SWIB/MDM2 domain-containing protein [Myxococcota bacterium]